jgi:hypothetical protein
LRSRKGQRIWEGKRRKKEREKDIAGKDRIENEEEEREVRGGNVPFINTGAA